MNGEPARYGVHRWSARTYLLLGGGGVLLVAAVVLRNPIPVFFGLALLLAPFATSWNYPRALRKVDLAWEEVGEGLELQVRGTLTAPFGGSAQDISVHFEPPLEVAVERELSYDRGPDAIRFATDWRCRVPYLSHPISAVVTWRDPLGLGERVLAGRRPLLLVERSAPDLRSLRSVRLPHTTPIPGGVRTHRTAKSGEFDCLRQAEPNEAVRFINWKATARLGQLVANEYEADQRADVILFLDLRPTSLGRYLDELLLSVGRAACLGLVRSFLRHKVRIGFASFGEFVHAVPLSSGRGHGYRVVQAIQASELAREAAVPERGAFGMRRFFPPGTMTIVVSSCTDDPASDLAPYLRRSGYPVVTLSPSPLPLREGSGGLDPARELLARRTERLVRRFRLAPLWRYGPVVDWEDYGSLEGLGRALGSSGRRRLG